MHTLSTTLQQTFEGQRTKEIQMDENFIQHPTWHQVDNISWSIGYFIRAHQKEKVGLTQNFVIVAFTKLPLAPMNIILPWWGYELKFVLQSLNMVHFHFKLNLRPHQLRGQVLIPVVQILDIHAQSPLIFKLMALSLCVKRS